MRGSGKRFTTDVRASPSGTWGRSSASGSRSRGGSGSTTPAPAAGTRRRAARRGDGKDDKPRGYSSYNRRLHQAAATADPVVPTVKYRATHGFRRHVVNNVLEATGGHLALAGQFIGDRDLPTLARSYARPRQDQMRAVADRMVDPLEPSPCATLCPASPRPRLPERRRAPRLTPGRPSHDTHDRVQLQRNYNRRHRRREDYEDPPTES